MNVIILTGKASKEIELRFSPSGTPIANGSIAIRRDYKNQQGEYETDFHNFVVIGKLGEVIANHVKKGDSFGIKGKLQNRVWESDSGKKYFTEVLVDGFDFPNKPKQDNSAPKQEKKNNTKITDDPFSGSGQINIDDSDLPF